jgi:UDP-N-acetyl-D-mannosaminuronic acid dehydrogenase
MKVYGAGKDLITAGLKSGEITIALYGLGRMGLPLAGIFADCGARVLGVDIDPNVVASVNRGDSHVIGEPGLQGLVRENVAAGRLRASSDFVDAAKKADIMVIVVPTPLDHDHNPDLSNLTSLYKQISKGLDKGDLVIQESTVPPRTTSEIIVPILEESGLRLGEFGVARCPEHAKYGSVIQDIRGSASKVVGGADEASTAAAAALYSAINSRGVIPVRDSTTAEAVKTFAGVYKDVNIAIANELAIISDDLGVNALEVFSAVERAGMATFFRPGCGVGGHCIPVCGHTIISAVKSDTRLLSLVREINNSMPAHIVQLTRRVLNEVGIEMREANVLVLGITYRGDIKDTLNSPSIAIIQCLNEQCNEVYAFDPLLLDEVENYGANVVNDLSEVGKDVHIDAIIVASDHSMFKEMDWSDLGGRVRQKIVVDGRHCLDRQRMKEAGWAVFGIGT